ncbi:hypothetical protein DM01DRAFT_330557 [Hesseltinella vesiculosa]|uniref:Rhodanese domain-containing protein n=1 Tax=Hesseltinella vesiculosa TaxID=101127 RepID=A0A1X2G6F7_9FUNG|nr:hypothetical protein DM01DRAFT_330557 [Hesseltinella vesiculosa]
MTSITELQLENKQLRQRIVELEAQLNIQSQAEESPILEKTASLSNTEIKRYGRQLILPKWGKPRAGGLGAPAALYLGAAGIGKLGIVDHDDVDSSNLHRQVIHTEVKEGMNKAVSAKLAIKAINSQCIVQTYPVSMERSNALEIIQDYDLVLDCTDNVATRYMLNDAAVLLGKPLVSGSALRYDGQLAVYNYQGGPCYRCLHPVPPPPETVGRCSDNGVLGAVPGVIGILQALEAIKVITGLHSGEPSFLIFSALSIPMFRTMKLRNKKSNCPACGDNPTITHLIDYVEFCGSEATDKGISQSLLAMDERVSVKEYHSFVNSGQPHLLVDVRPSLQIDICSLPHSVNIPIDELDKRVPEIKQMMKLQQLEGKDRKNPTNASSIYDLTLIYTV